MKVGLIGLGNMGLPMAENMIKAGHELVIYNRTASKAESLVKKGAKVVETPAQAAQEANLVFTILSNDEALEEVTLSEAGVLAGLQEGGIHVSVSTISVDLSEKLTSAHAASGQHFVAATVLGRPDAAAAAALKVIVAGNKEAREHVCPLFEAIGQTVFTVGDEPYLSNVAKLGNNFLLVSMLEAVSEAVVMVEQYGMQAEEFLEVVNSLFASPVYKNYGNLIAKRDFDPAGFKLELGLKDVNLAIDAAKKVSAPLPLGELVKGHYEQGIENGWGHLDWSALLKTVEALKKDN
ncbi:NAD(P)-dependent oxidoreductase [Priestia megaterium]|uniref:NAD(P)-dependent oxidoreductase n=1 Tax=Priestia megaterium TaxID=1404 RepID=UPI00301BC41B